MCNSVNAREIYDVDGVFIYDDESQTNGTLITTDLSFDESEYETTGESTIVKLGDIVFKMVRCFA